ncbi:transglutaminase domain-containing protein [Planococcus sp. APC 4015]|nr:transglutaminase domain-containing protein [Planococcus sp. APC 4015]
MNTPRMRRDAASAAVRVQPRVVAGSLYTAAVVVSAACAAWPIYRTSAFLVLVAAASVIAAVIAVAAHRWRWSGWIVSGVVAAALLITGVPLAIPSRLGGPLDLLRGLGDLSAGVIVAWKDLVTVDLPVGSYRNLLVPALVVFLVGTCAMLLLSWSDGRRAVIAAPIALAMVSFGLFFGRTDVSAPLSLGPVTLYAPVETALGISGLLTTLLWLAWRTHDQRVRALQRAAVASGVRVSRHATPADRRRAGLGIGMIGAAVAIAVVVVPFAARGADRDVLRSAFGPEIDVSAELSPLAEYRAYFDDGRADDVLFSVAAGTGAPDRVRLATLSEYDGEFFRAGDGTADGRFVRVPATMEPGRGEPFALTVAIEDWQGLWMPTAGRLAGVDFTGARSAALADGFYYNADAAAGVQAVEGGLSEGDGYVLSGVDTPAPPLASLQAPGADTDAAVPESLRTWVETHATGTGGAALADLVSLLRERGYLSHALSVGEDKTAIWMQSLTDYTFQPSASGHSLGRIDSLFTKLLEREGDPRAQASGNFVAAVGDDEQFAVATALIARELGFPSRVVVGARLASSEEGLATCDEGVCRAQDLAVWTEVHAADGQWVAIDVTPQYAQSPSLEVTQQRDPEVVTDVRPDSVEEIVPPDPVQQDAVGTDDPDDAAGLDLTWLQPVLRVTGIVSLVLLLLVGPFAAVVLAKVFRRRGRRSAASPAERVAGGWEEWVDAATDAGRTLPRTATRSEVAALVGTPAGAGLAAVADQAVFAGASGGPAETDADEYWALVERERRELLRARGLWRNVLATVSLRSIIRPLAPASSARTLFAERGRRPGPRPLRPTT